MKIQRYRSSYILLGLIFSLASGMVSSQNQENEALPDSYHDFLINAYNAKKLNGNVLIVEKGEIAYQGAFGISNINPIDSLQLDSRFRLASVSKQFTATGIMKLKESGKLTYDQDIKDFIPELPYKDITIRHLVNHTSGLPDYVGLMNENWKAKLKVDDPERFVGNDEVIAMLVDKKPIPRFKPGEKWEYSNTGYLLLASIVRRASGKPFETYLKEQVFDPAKMMHTSVYKFVPGNDANMPKRVYGYSVGSNASDLTSNDVHYLNTVQGDGGIYSTVGDLYKWDRLLHTNQLVSEDMKKDAFTPGVLSNGDQTNYGFGWSIEQQPSGQKVVSHGGGWVGFRTHIYREIDANNCIILLTNHSSPHFDKILDGLKMILHNRTE